MFASSLLGLKAKSNQSKTRLLTRVYFSFCTVVCFLVLQQSWNFWLLFLNQKAANYITNSLQIERETQRLLNVLTYEERANQQPDYSPMSSTFSNRLSKLSHLLSDMPAVKAQQIDWIKYLYNEWHSQVNQRHILEPANSFTFEEQAALVSLSNRIQLLSEKHEEFLQERRYHILYLYRIYTGVNIISTILILLIVSWNIYFLLQRVELPLRNLMKIGELWQAGQLEARLPYASTDEIGRLTKILNSIANKASQRQQNLKAQNQRLEDLISALSHDLRTPLLATRNTLDCMLKGAFGYVSNSFREVLEEYRQANEDLLKLVETLLDISRYEYRNKTGNQLVGNAINWENILTKVITLVKNSSNKEIIFTCKISPSLPVVYANNLEIQRVLQNLLENAVRVSQPNREIVLEIVTLGDTEIKVSVQDKGPGITPLEKEKLFHRFIQGKSRRGKSGLGLYLCRQIIENHGGMIDVNSSPGAGSTFWFTLPVFIEKIDVVA
ncbi:MAG: ATP-binding protein [Aulosira sp. ZfuVER01]|nr:HAMP domain-containing sensor histidine kinase [Aulosira sp. ZfuVER01]MDZ8001984.1 HAMP domain-containing sensor histidine kinase [Aulosira sp. DedVER01a]MDZ8054938.1 HAMP domain-containing sensor histidine kinase [Aulosira sp. ZfuCHP01]